MTQLPVVHFEIGCFDGEKMRAFLSGLFGWAIGDADAGWTIAAGPSSALSGHIVELAPEWGTYVLFYVGVPDLETALARAAELGGQVLVEPVTLPGDGCFAWIAAPEGQKFGLWESNN